MTWANWTTYFTPVFDMVYNLMTQTVTWIMSSPVTGVPVMLGFSGIIFGVISRFVGSFTRKNEK